MCYLMSFLGSTYIGSWPIFFLFNADGHNDVNSAKHALLAPKKPNTTPTLALPQGTSSMTIEAIVVVATTYGLQLLVQSSNVAYSQGCYEPIIQEPMTPESNDVSDYNIEDYPLAVFDLVLS